MPDTIPVTIEAGTLAPPACYSNEQERYEAYIAATTAYIAGTNLEWVVQSGTPGAGDQGKAWLRIDINGYPIEALFWVTAAGTWVRWFTVPKYPASSGGVANALTITFNPTVLTRAVGDRFWFIAAATSTGATTLAIDSLAAAPILKSYNTALVANDIKAGQVVEVIWDGTNYQMVSQTANAALVVSNLVPGTEGQVVITKGGVAGWSSFRYVTSAVGFNTITAGSPLVTKAHGLPSIPGFFEWRLVCTADDAGYVVGQELQADSMEEVSAGQPYFACYADATNLYIVGLVVGGVLASPGANHATTGATLTAINPAKWNLVCYYAL